MAAKVNVVKKVRTAARKQAAAARNRSAQRMAKVWNGESSAFPGFTA